jgi:hypothetical protein
VASMRCECSQIVYRNNHDGSRDYRIQGKNGCMKCRGTGMVDNCSVCDGCGMIPGSRVCPGCSGYGVVKAEAVTWTRKQAKLPA